MKDQDLKIGDIVTIKDRELPPMFVFDLGPIPRSLNKSERFIIVMSKNHLESYSAQAKKFKLATEAEVKKYKKMSGPAPQQT